MIKVEQITKKFNTRTIFKDITFEAKKGEIVGIVGPSGEGKTTLLKCINLIENIDSGEIYLDRQIVSEVGISDTSIKGSLITMLFQNINLFMNLTVKENISLAMKLVKNVEKEIADIKSEILLDSVNLLDKKNEYPSSLSGGQAQRVAICRALALEPKILLFDEPTSALDNASTENLSNIILDINDKRNTTIIIVSHDLGFVKKLANRILLLKNGKLSTNL